jgi:hypothetical protein
MRRQLPGSARAIGGRAHAKEDSAQVTVTLAEGFSIRGCLAE